MSTISGLTGSFGQTGSMRSSGFSPPAFSSLDGDSNGGVSLDELKSALSDSSASSANGVEALFKAMDADQDGSVSESEKGDFDSALQDRMSTMQVMAQIAGQGEEETGASGAAGGRPSGPPPGPPPSSEETASSVVDAADTNGDGKVSLDEMMAALEESGDSEAYSSDDVESAFSLLDSDSDGALTSTEISEFLQSMQPPQSQQQMAFGGPPPADWMQQANSAYASNSAVNATSYLAAA